MNTRELRNCLGRFATGVTVVTCRGEDGYHGLTVNAFTSVSLEPPLVLVSIDRRNRAERFLRGAPFTFNVLAADQEREALHFAGRSQDDLQIEWEEGRLAPRLARWLAYIECSPWREYDGGDHTLFLGKVEEFAYRDGAPLVFYAGEFRVLNYGSEEEG